MIGIVGGSGFIGSILALRLSHLGLPFKIFDIKTSPMFPANTVITDVCSIESLRAAITSDITTLINLAAEHRDDVTPQSLYHDVNVCGASNLCKVATEQFVNNIIFTSSVAVYGFAAPLTNEFGSINPFNNYGRTKWQAEKVYEEWQNENPMCRVLTIVRPTVVFGEGNRGNVYNLLRQIASGRFVMVGNGLNRKSIAYVENVAAFLEYAFNFKPGVHVFNYIDKPDFTMNSLVLLVNRMLNRAPGISFRLPFSLGLAIGYCFDFLAKVTGKKYPISAIRVKKFCANSIYQSAVESTGFIPPVPLMSAIKKTIRYEFIDHQKDENVFYSE